MSIKWTYPQSATCIGCGNTAAGSIYTSRTDFGSLHENTVPAGWWVGFDTERKTSIYVCSEACAEKVAVGGDDAG